MEVSTDLEQGQRYGLCFLSDIATPQSVTNRQYSAHCPYSEFYAAPAYTFGESPAPVLTN